MVHRHRLIQRMLLPALAATCVACVSYSDIATDGQRVYLVRGTSFLFFGSQDVLECRAGSSPLVCREVTPGEPRANEFVVSVDSVTIDPGSKVPDGLTALLVGQEIAVTTTDDRVLGGTVAASTAPDTLTLVENGVTSYVKWRNVKRISKNLDTRNPYD